MKRALVILFDSATIQHNFNVKRMTHFVSEIENKPQDTAKTNKQIYNEIYKVEFVKFIFI